VITIQGFTCGCVTGLRLITWSEMYSICIQNLYLPQCKTRKINELCAFPLNSRYAMTSINEPAKEVFATGACVTWLVFGNNIDFLNKKFLGKKLGNERGLNKRLLMGLAKLILKFHVLFFHFQSTLQQLF